MNSQAGQLQQRAVEQTSQSTKLGEFDRQQQQLESIVTDHAGQLQRIQTSFSNQVDVFGKQAAKQDHQLNLFQSNVISDVQQLINKLHTMDNKLQAMDNNNTALWQQNNFLIN